MSKVLIDQQRYQELRQAINTGAIVLREEPRLVDFFDLATGDFDWSAWQAARDGWRDLGYESNDPDDIADRETEEVDDEREQAAVQEQLARLAAEQKRLFEEAGIDPFTVFDRSGTTAELLGDNDPFTDWGGDGR